MIGRLAGFVALSLNLSLACDQPPPVEAPGDAAITNGEPPLPGGGAEQSPDSTPPLPTQPLSFKAQNALLRYYESGDQASLDEALRYSTTIVESVPQHRYGRLLQALTLDLQGKGAELGRALQDMGPVNAVTWSYFFKREPQQVQKLLECSRMAICLKIEHRSGQHIPNGAPLEYAGGQRSGDGPIRCMENSLDPGTCPVDFPIFERLTWVERDAIRLQLWVVPEKEYSFSLFAEHIGLSSGDRVADIGAGVGWFSLRFADVVGTTGKVFALDIDRHCVDYLKLLSSKAGYPQLVPVLSEPGDLTLPHRSVDLTFMGLVLSDLALAEQGQPGDEQGGPTADLLASAFRSLVPGGRAVILDQVPKDGKPGYQVQQVHELMEAAGFEHVRSVADFAPARYLEIYRRPAKGRTSW